MIQILLILSVAAILARDQLPTPIGLSRLTHGQIALAGVGPFVLIAICTQAFLYLARRRLDKTGSIGVLNWADRVLNFGRWLSVVWHILAVVALGFLDVIHDAVRYTLIADALAILPLLLTITAGWWSYAPIERRLREVSILHNLDEGLPVHAPPSRGEIVWMHVRHQLLLVLVPLGALLVWSQGVTALLFFLVREHDWERLARWPLLDSAASWLSHDSNRELTRSVAQGVGMILVFSFMPLALRFVWDTIPLGPGLLRDRLLALCTDQGVRVRNLLVWRTRGSMVNGAVLGLLGRLRYVLLTDALLDLLPENQIEAVMAHEVGHVRRRHVPWLVLVLLASLLGSVAIAEFVGNTVAATLALDVHGWAAGGIDLVASAMGLVSGLALFGFASRRFEWQADAFAAQHLSGVRFVPQATRAPSEPPQTITPAAIESMAGALDAVARLNHIPRHKFTWRHGSIHRRIRNLYSLHGRLAASLPIDRTVSIIKITSAVVCLILFGLLIHDSLSTSSAS